MSEATYDGFKDLPSNNERSSWPPTEEQIRDVAIAALNKSQDKDVTVLIYWENDPNLMIFDPIHFANTEYIFM